MLQSGVVLRCRWWLAALVLLAVNDHLLKGSGLLPGVVTGKLSDFAGLFIAPTLLAILLPTRGRGALLACHLAVAAVFSGIQLSPALATSWSWLTGLLGFPWVTTSDPTDLIALVAVLASYHRFAPTLDLPPQPPLWPVLRRGVVAVSLVLCLATSDTFEDWGNIGRGVHLHNASSRTLEVQLRGLRDSVLIDCSVVASDPGRLIPESAFGLATRYTVTGGRNLPVGSHEHSGSCSAILVSGSGLMPTMLFFDHSRSFGNAPSSYSPDDEFLSGVVVIDFDSAKEHVGYTTLVDDGELLFDHAPGSPELASECRPADSGTRLAWSSGLSSGSYRLDRIDRAPDGCFALELAAVAAQDPTDSDGGVADGLDLDAGVPAESGEEGPALLTFTEYVCPGLDTLPFETGDALEVSTVGGLTLSSADAIVRVFSAGDLSSAAGPAEVPADSAWWSVDEQILELSFHPRDQCDYFVQEDCARVGRVGYLELSTSDAVAIVEPGAGVARVGDAAVAVAPLVEQLALIDTQCAGEGRGRLGADFDMGVLVERVGQ